MPLVMLVSSTNCSGVRWLIFHGDDVGFLGEFLERAHRYRHPMMGRIVIDHYAHLRQRVGDIVIKLHRVIDTRLIVEGDTEQHPVSASVLGELCLTNRLAWIQIRTAYK